MENKHTHKFEKEKNYYICSCGLKRLAFEDQKGMRSDGKSYTKKANINRFFFPGEYIELEDKLKPNQRHSIKFLLNTGARISELQKAQVQDFIYNEKGRSRLILRHTKTKAKKGEFRQGKVRDVPLSKQFSKYLNKYIQEKGLKPEDTFNILTASAINDSLKKTAQLVKINHPEDFSCHSLRKTLEVWLMAIGVDSLPLTAHLGHDIRTAASHYVSPDIFSWEDKKLIRQIIGDLYER
jgi:integrase